MTSGTPTTTGARDTSQVSLAPVGEEADGLEHDERLAGALRIAVTRLGRRLRAAQADESLTLSQLSALASLDRHGPCSPTALAEIERVQPPSMTRVLAGLEERGLTRRAPHETDRRQAVIDLSDAGRALLEETRKQRHAWFTRCLDDLSPEDRERLRAALPVLERLGQA